MSAYVCSYLSFLWSITSSGAGNHRDTLQETVVRLYKNKNACVNFDNRTGLGSADQIWDYLKINLWPQRWNAHQVARKLLIFITQSRSWWLICLVSHFHKASLRKVLRDLKNPQPAQHQHDGKRVGVIKTSASHISLSCSNLQLSQTSPNYP